MIILSIDIKVDVGGKLEADILGKTLSDAFPYADIRIRPATFESIVCEIDRNDDSVNDNCADVHRLVDEWKRTFNLEC